MKYRIREEVFGDSSRFFTERWYEPYRDWVAALHCSFDSLKSAQEGLDFYNKSVISYTDSIVIHEYIPERPLE